MGDEKEKKEKKDKKEKYGGLVYNLKYTRRRNMFRRRKKTRSRKR